MASFTGFPVNAARYTSERLEDLYKTELRSTIETSDLPVSDLRRFRVCPQHRTQATLERSKVYWSWPLLLQAQGQRGNSHIRMTSRPHRLKTSRLKTSSMQSKRRDLHHTWLHRETNEKLSFYCYSPRWITTTFFTKLTDIYFSWILKDVRD